MNRTGNRTRSISITSWQTNLIATRSNQPRAPQQVQAGVTVIELMVVVALMGVLFFSVPSFINFLEQQRITATVNSFVLAINYARTEAASRRAIVSVRAANTSNNANVWGEGGWCVVVGQPANCDDALRNFEAPPNGVTLDGEGVLDDVVMLSYDSRGILTPTLAAAANVDLCSSDGTFGRRVAVSAIGRISVTEETAADLGC